MTAKREGAKASQAESGQVPRTEPIPSPPDPPPNSFAPDKSTTTAERPRYHPKSRQHSDETSESNPMKMIRHDGKPQQADAERAGQALSLIFNHHFAVILVLAAHRIVAKEIPATNHAMHHMHSRNRRKHFRSCHPRHHSAPNQNWSKSLCVPMVLRSLLVACQAPWRRSLQLQRKSNPRSGWKPHAVVGCQFRETSLSRDRRTPRDVGGLRAVGRVCENDRNLLARKVEAAHAER